MKACAITGDFTKVFELLNQIENKEFVQRIQQKLHNNLAFKDFSKEQPDLVQNFARENTLSSLCDSARFQACACFARFVSTRLETRAIRGEDMSYQVNKVEIALFTTETTKTFQYNQKVENTGFQNYKPSI